MGWGSVSSISRTVADALTEANASDAIKERALTNLDDPAIVAAFAANDITWD